MAGDEISATAQYYYQNAVTNTTGNNLTTNIITALVQSILGSPSTGLAKGNTPNISSQLNADPSFVSKTAPDASNPAGNNPKAYLSIIFFDERFNYVAENSTTIRVSQQGDAAAPLVLGNVKSPKNGYVYVYLSNESNEPVYFDNFTVGDNRGRIIEEDHYYAFGLKIAAISSKKLADLNEGNIDNKHFYNDKELFDDADLDWYDYGFRNYDPQIGRFPQLDPLTDEYPELTPYQYASNDPIANIDIDGLEGFNALKVLDDILVIGHKTVKTANTGLTALRVGAVAVKAADIATDFIPVVSGAKDIYNGIKTGNGWQIALGAGSIALDFFTFGGSSIAKGAIKTAVREGAVILAKREAKRIAEKSVLKTGILKFGCFVKGTPVWATDSTIAIEKIKAGDYVYAYDITKKQVVKKKVIHTYVREVNHLIKLDYQEETIYTTTEHPFYINNGWVKASELNIGDSLFLKNGKVKIPVQKITVIDTTVTVYNITVADAHDYYVGNAKVLVHNNPCAQAAGSGSKKYTIAQVKKALKQVHEKVGKIAKGKKGKYGSPQRGNSTKGYRLDSEGHPNSTNPAEKGPHINYWDYTNKKRKAGGESDAIPIK